MKVEPFFVPGSQWLYFKFYMGEGTSNKLLIERINPLIEQQLRQSRIIQWFFIRYHDPGHHLRIRLLLSQKEFLSAILSDFLLIGTEMMQEGYVSDVQLATYKRELSRYGERNIGRIEKLWFWESIFIINSIRELNNGKEHILCVLTAINLLLVEFYQTVQDKMQFVNMNFDLFCREFNLKKSEKRKLAGKFRDIHSEMDYWVSKPSSKLGSYSWYTDYVRNMKAITYGLDRSQAENLIVSLIHMLVNRSFDRSQRKMEMVLYHHLTKYYQSVLARKNSCNE